MSNNEAIANFLGGKRNLAAYQLSQLLKEQSSQRQPCNDELAFNYALVNLFTGCPQRASSIFLDLAQRYPRNPRLWLRLAESMLATERFNMADFEHLQQLAQPNSQNHLVKTKNKPILIKINPSYCQQQQHHQSQPRANHNQLAGSAGQQRKTPANLLASVRGYLTRSLSLINEYNDISLITDDIPYNLDATNQAANKAVSQKLSFANPYQCISRSDLYHLCNKVRLNLAYVCLCMGEPLKSVEYTTKILEMSTDGYERVLASLYYAEACILVTKFDAAIRVLNLEILEIAKSLPHEHPAVKNDTGPVIYDDTLRRQLKTGIPATAVAYNLSVAFGCKGNLANAHEILMQLSKPSSIQVILCLLYIQLQQGNVEAAKKTIFNHLPHLR